MVAGLASLVVMPTDCPEIASKSKGRVPYGPVVSTLPFPSVLLPKLVQAYTGMKWEVEVPRDWRCTDVSGEGAVSHTPRPSGDSSFLPWGCAINTDLPSRVPGPGGPETITRRACHVQALLEYSSPPSVEGMNSFNLNQPYEVHIYSP